MQHLFGMKPAKGRIEREVPAIKNEGASATIASLPAHALRCGTGSSPRQPAPAQKSEGAARIVTGVSAYDLRMGRIAAKAEVIPATEPVKAEKTAPIPPVDPFVAKLQTAIDGLEKLPGQIAQSVAKAEAAKPKATPAPAKPKAVQKATKAGLDLGNLSKLVRSGALPVKKSAAGGFDMARVQKLARAMGVTIRTRS